MVEARNLTGTNLLTMAEASTYRPHLENPNWYVRKEICFGKLPTSGKVIITNVAHMKEEKGGHFGSFTMLSPSPKHNSVRGLSWSKH